MITTCPSCNAPQPAIAFTISDKEIINMRHLGLSEHLCKACYQEKLTNLAATSKSALASLNEQRETAKLAYEKAYEAWKTKADLFRAIDYNINLIKFEEEKKTKPTKISTDSPEKKSKIEKKVTQILNSLSQEQQESILKLFQSIKPSEESYDSVWLHP